MSGILKTAKTVVKKIILQIPLIRRQLLPSTDYRVLSSIDEARSLQAKSDGWLLSRTVARQERAYASLLAKMKRGSARLDFQIGSQAVTATGLSNPSLLEVGCGSGYYAEVLSTLLPGGVRYTGLDYAASMIDRAKIRYPDHHFKCGDATQLPYPDRQFDIVFNGVSLMHILEYRAAIAEASRTAKQYCIFHTVPVFVDDHPTTFLTKYAYGSPVVEIVFSQRELIRVCETSGLALVQEWDCLSYNLFEQIGRSTTTKSYLFRKVDTVSTS